MTGGTWVLTAMAALAAGLVGAVYWVKAEAAEAKTEAERARRIVADLTAQAALLETDKAFHESPDNLRPLAEALGMRPIGSHQLVSLGEAQLLVAAAPSPAPLRPATAADKPSY